MSEQENLLEMEKPVRFIDKFSEWLKGLFKKKYDASNQLNLENNSD